MVVRFPAPASVTGEDCAELHLHGSHAVVSAVLEALRSLPFVRPAQAGEFTRRAFEGGKLDLTQVEGLSDLLSAQTESQRAQALFAARGSLGRRYARWRETLLSSLAAVEACIDFGEDEHIADQVAFESEGRIKALAGELHAALQTGHRGELVREGLRVAIMGAPNAGKSSLLNALAGKSVAIVSATPGTTRDVLHADLDLGGICARVSDCAGLRETADEIEREGVRRALELAKEAHLLVLVVDDSAAKQASVASPASETLEGADMAPQQLMQIARPHARVVLVRNKADLAIGPGRAAADSASWTAAKESPILQAHAECNVSCVTGEGIDALIAALGEQAAAYVERSGDAGEDHSEAPTALITRERHRRAVEEALEHLEAYAAHPTTLELAGEDIRRAARALGSVTGALETEDVLDRVFSQFCIGK
ncbi:hypothetical protein H632_c108p2 [Helicosporidium sp. ATCC 50920]|nr:hypothetical protein H632_c108p2 [Helicosporidium sp. ATCC 50920]|eukprot:KDD76777.1 hypothetical protein H632_c108p2 [Helicosporidium sp. ATCC 50920]